MAILFKTEAKKLYNQFYWSENLALWTRAAGQDFLMKKYLNMMQIHEIDSFYPATPVQNKFWSF